MKWGIISQMAAQGASSPRKMKPLNLDQAKGLILVKRGTERRTQMPKGRHRHQGRKTSIKGHRISRMFNQEMEDRETNLATAPNKGRLGSHKLTSSVTNTNTGQRNFPVAIPIGKRPWTKHRF